MKAEWKTGLHLAALLMLLPGVSNANDFMFSQSTALVVGPAFLLWFVVGLILIYVKKRRDLNLLGFAGLLVFSFFMFIIVGHPEIALNFWLIYIALLSVYYLFPRAGVAPATRRINLSLHGSFLVLVIVGGFIAKYFYWSQMGGFASWSAWMREIFPGFLIAFGVFALLVVVRVYFGIVRSDGKVKSKA